mmetsp:Transcript_80185/g.146269  ORF Transcript_80185/g.146269 Transcript_80185/m.146269 type:complete len:89 (-) Transcript_80185:334-600(-)
MGASLVEPELGLHIVLLNLGGGPSDGCGRCKILFVMLLAEVDAIGPGAAITCRAAAADCTLESSLLCHCIDGPAAPAPRSPLLAAAYS